MVSTNDISPVKTSERFVILDALRGFALLGICMANFPEFSLYTFLSLEAVAAMPTAVADTITRYLLYIFVDGKFYTLFSLLFGICCISLSTASSIRCFPCCSASASPSSSAMRSGKGRTDSASSTGGWGCCYSSASCT